MSWAGIANNQCVSFANLKDAVDTGVFISKTTQSTSLEQITKADADTYVYIDTTYAPYSGKTSNQLVVKSDLRGGFLLYGGSFGCVVPETDILIAPNITKKAGDFTVGELVYTQHESTKDWGYYKIQNLEKKVQPILFISTSQGQIMCSTTHLVSKNNEFVEAQNLLEGDTILHINGDAIVTQIRPKEESEVIEFTIEDAHTYVAAGFISHNKCTLIGWTNCADACNNGVTAYYTAVNYTGVLQVGTIINSPTCFLDYIKFYYYVGGFIEIEYDGTDLKVKSLGSCGSCTTTSTTTTTTTSATVDIYINNNNSLDIPITGMTINGVAVTYSSGANFTINAGNNGNFTSTQLGTYTVVISYGSHISGQKITFEDSNNNVTCKDLNGSAGSFTIPNSVITGGTTIYVTGEDGSCI